jgi:hypothetical protein
MVKLTKCQIKRFPPILRLPTALETLDFRPVAHALRPTDNPGGHENARSALEQSAQKCAVLAVLCSISRYHGNCFDVSNGGGVHRLTDTSRLPCSGTEDFKAESPPGQVSDSLEHPESKAEGA